MRQPISRRSFDPRLGDLGVYLQEGAPFVDSTWNVATDVLSARLAALAEDAGATGALGSLLAIEPIVGADGKLANLVVKGGPGRVYCGGLPILWPEDRPIDAQDLAQAWFVDGASRPANGPWLDALTVDTPYTVYAIGRAEIVDDLDQPDLDDPGLDAERGSFRARARAQIRISKDALPTPPRTDLRLTLQGEYLADVNALYWVEVGALHQDGKSVPLLWDDADAGVVGLVTSHVKKGAMQVPLSRTEGFDPGSFVRFEATSGAGVDGALYQVVTSDANIVTVTRHDCEKPPHDLSSRCVASIRLLPSAGVEAAFPDAFDGTGLSAVIAVGDRVTGLRATNDPGSASIVYSVKNRESVGETVVFTLAPEGLTQGLDPWYTDVNGRASRLVGDAHAFKYCVDVEPRAMWTEGVRVRFSQGVSGQDEMEDRTVVRIVQHPTSMTLRLDQPLSYPHADAARVAPQRLIKARRFRGHVCKAEIAFIDPAGACCLELPGQGVRLPSGISVHLSFERPSGSQVIPAVTPGDGWTFAARAGGWVETRAFAPVLKEPEGVVLLARLTLAADGTYQLDDLRKP